MRESRAARSIAIFPDVSERSGLVHAVADESSYLQSEWLKVPAGPQPARIADVRAEKSSARRKGQKRRRRGIQIRTPIRASCRALKKWVGGALTAGGEEMALPRAVRLRASKSAQKGARFRRSERTRFRADFHARDESGHLGEPIQSDVAIGLNFLRQFGAASRGENEIVKGLSLGEPNSQ